MAANLIYRKMWKNHRYLSHGRKNIWCFLREDGADGLINISQITDFSHGNEFLILYKNF